MAKKPFPKTSEPVTEPVAPPLEAVVEEPTLKAFTVERVKGGWQFVTLSYRGDQLIDIQRGEPNLKAIILEQFKIASFHYWSKVG